MPHEVWIRQERSDTDGCGEAEGNRLLRLLGANPGVSVETCLEKVQR